MKYYFILVVISTLFFVFYGCSQNSVYLIFDNDIPGTVPKIFAKNIFDKDSSYIGYCSFYNKGEEFYYAITNRQWNTSQILKLTSDKQIDTLHLNINAQWIGEPMFTLDEKRMYFTAIAEPLENLDWHADLFYIEIKDDGWSEPKNFELNSLKSEWHISFTKNNVAYFGSERDGARLSADLFYSKLEDGKYKKAIKLPSKINSQYNDCDPLISPDESYLIFHSDRPGGYGEHDLYVAFRKGENDWTEPENLGGNINTDGWEMGPSISPDGKYLFFTRRKSWNTDEPSKIYWVDISIIENMKRTTITY